MLLQAQLSIATAADQRGLTWGGLLLTGATAALGGGVALLLKKSADQTLSYLALLLAGGLFISAWLAISTVKPKLFCLPGNTPGSWLPSAWDCFGTDKEKVQKARRDQAAQLDKFIQDNAETAKTSAGRMKWSFGIAVFSVFAAMICFFLYLLDRL